MCVAQDHHVGPLLTRQQGEIRLVVVVAVDHQKSPAERLDRLHCREPLADERAVGVAVDGHEVLGQVPEAVEHRRRREIPGVNDDVGGTHLLAEVVGEAGVVGAVRVRECEEHTGRSGPETKESGNPWATYDRPSSGRVMASSKSVVIAALIANGAIAILKFGGFLLTGSPSMLSETYHSISDTGNQVFLLIGIRYSSNVADDRHPFGYGKAQFFYSFLVSVLLFGIAGWESAKHGYHEVREALGHGGGHGSAEAVTLAGQTFPSVYVNYAVLVGAIVFESYAMYKATKALKRQIRKNDWSGYREAFRKTADTTTLTAFTEDGIALGGAGIALFGIFLTRRTGNPIYDAAAALFIGLLLMFFAVALAWENKRLLMGESLPNENEDTLRALVADVEGVESVVDFRSVYFGPKNVLVTTDLTFESGIESRAIDQIVDAVEDALKDANDDIKSVYVEVEQSGTNSLGSGQGDGDGH